RARERERVEAVGADPDRPAPTARAERQHAEEAVEQILEAPRRDHCFELRAIVGERGARPPLREVLERARAILVRDAQRGEAALERGVVRRCAHADLRTRTGPSKNSASARPVASGSWWISAPGDARSARTMRYGAAPSAARSSATGAAPSRA